MHIILPLGVFVLLEVFALILMSNDSIIQSYKLIGNIRSVELFFWERGENLRDYSNLRHLNIDLAKENSLLRSILEKKYHQTYDSTSYRVDSLYFIPAMIRYNSVSSKHNYMIINKGEKHGIYKGMGVITPQGIAGYIEQVSKNYSRVRSFLNIDSEFGAVIKKNNVFGTLKWNGLKSNEAILEDIPLHTIINIGDTIVSSSFSAIYPKELPLGTINSYEVLDGTSLSLKISLFENYNSLDIVYIVDIDGANEINQLMEDVKNGN